LEFILPRSKEDEEVVVGDGIGLCGVAVAPVQGCGVDGGRWRLLMYFGEHRVVGWEIERKGAVGIGELVV
jgi:hypothetical protein